MFYSTMSNKESKLHEYHGLDEGKGFDSRPLLTHQNINNDGATCGVVSRGTSGMVID